MKYLLISLSIFLTACTPPAVKKDPLSLEVPPELLEEPVLLKTL